MSINRNEVKKRKQLRFEEMARKRKEGVVSRYFLGEEEKEDEDDDDEEEVDDEKEEVDEEEEKEREKARKEAWVAMAKKMENRVNFAYDKERAKTKGERPMKNDNKKKKENKGEKKEGENKRKREEEEEEEEEAPLFVIDKKKSNIKV